MQIIRIKIEGGLIQEITGIPGGMAVQVYDYDIQGVDEDRISPDYNGRPCIDSFYASEEDE